MKKTINLNEIAILIGFISMIFNRNNINMLIIVGTMAIVNAILDLK